MIFNDLQLHEFFFKSERRTDWNVKNSKLKSIWFLTIYNYTTFFQVWAADRLKCRKTAILIWKRVTSSKRQPYKTSGEQDISNEFNTWSYRYQMVKFSPLSSSKFERNSNLESRQIRFSLCTRDSTKIFQRKQKMTSFDRSVPIKFHATFQDTIM